MQNKKDILKYNFTQKLIDVFQALSVNNRLRFVKDNQGLITISDGWKLLKLNPDEFVTASQDALSILFAKPSPEQDFFLDLTLLKSFIDHLTRNNAIIRLNHIGICYQVNSQNEERKRLLREVTKSDWKFYEMPSKDVALWLFAGDIKNWQDPMIEFLPIEKIDVPDAQWLMPHVHLDIDTNLSYDKIEEAINLIFQGVRKGINTVVIDKEIYQIRIWLGIISGINIDLDMSTNKRNVKWSRQNYMKRII